MDLFTKGLKGWGVRKVHDRVQKPKASRSNLSQSQTLITGGGGVPGAWEVSLAERSSGLWSVEESVRGNCKAREPGE